MFARSSCKFACRAFSSSAKARAKSHAAHWAVASSTFAGLSLYFLSLKPVFNDTIKEDLLSAPKPQLKETGLSPLVWGSNQNHLIAPERDSKEYIKSPTPAPDLFSSPLRDLTFSYRHAACVDAAGDVYQWGDGFFGTEPVKTRRPLLTLSGKNIVSLAITPSKIFALSSSGKIYELPSELSRPRVPIRKHSGWNIFGQSGTDPSTYRMLKPDVALGSGERFTSISAGSHHLIALTSSGRTFSHPVTHLANWHGQLGLRKISLPDSSDSTKRVPLELSPRPLRDPNGNINRATPDLSVSDIFVPGASDGKSVGFCDRLFEVPALRGVDVGQVVTGDRTSFIVTRRDGRVLAWGANEYGQLGLGANITLPLVAVPTEVVLSNFTGRGTLTRCLNVAAGGDLTMFTVEREAAGPGTGLVEVLACGNGQWGGLGSATYSNAQGTPVKVRNISGILEYSDDAKSLKPLRPYQLSIASGPPADDSGMPSFSSGHVLATLDTLPRSHPDPKTGIATESAHEPGRGIFAWGLNQQYQLGTGKRTSANSPVHVPALGDGDDWLMCRVREEKVVDFIGSVVGKKMRVEQQVVAGPGMSVVYWRVV